MIPCPLPDSLARDAKRRALFLCVWLYLFGDTGKILPLQLIIIIIVVSTVLLLFFVFNRKKSETHRSREKGYE